MYELTFGWNDISIYDYKHKTFLKNINTINLQINKPFFYKEKYLGYMCSGEKENPSEVILKIISLDKKLIPIREDRTFQLIHDVFDCVILANGTLITTG